MERNCSLEVRSRPADPIPMPHIAYVAYDSSGMCKTKQNDTIIYALTFLLRFDFPCSMQSLGAQLAVWWTSDYCSALLRFRVGRKQ
jgi:hypothetical protein